MSTTTSSRTVSLVTALILSAVLLLYPRILGTRLGAVEHATLPVLLLGISGAFVSGLGYRPDNRITRVAFSAVASWLLLAVGIGILVFHRLAG